MLDGWSLLSMGVVVLTKEVVVDSIKVWACLARD